MPTFCVSGGAARHVCPEDHLDKVKTIAYRVARSYGLEIFEVLLRRESIGWVLRVTVDRPPANVSSADETRDAIAIADCQRVSADLSAVLDVDVSFEFAYTLEVTSPGLDRPLRDLDDCKRFKGRLAKIVMTEAVDGQRHLVGRITAVEDEQVVIETKCRVHRIPWLIVEQARLKVEF